MLVNVNYNDISSFPYSRSTRFSSLQKQVFNEQEPDSHAPMHLFASNKHMPGTVVVIIIIIIIIIVIIIME